MQLFVLFLATIFVAGIPLAKYDIKWTYLFAFVAMLALSFAYFFLNQI